MTEPETWMHLSQACEYRVLASPPVPPRVPPGRRDRRESGRVFSALSPGADRPAPIAEDGARRPAESEGKRKRAREESNPWPAA